MKKILFLISIISTLFSQYTEIKSIGVDNNYTFEDGLKCKLSVSFDDSLCYGSSIIHTYDLGDVSIVPHFFKMLKDGKHFVIVGRYNYTKSINYHSQLTNLPRGPFILILDHFGKIKFYQQYQFAINTIEHDEYFDNPVMRLCSKPKMEKNSLRELDNNKFEFDINLVRSFHHVKDSTILLNIEF